MAYETSNIEGKENPTALLTTLLTDAEMTAIDEYAERNKIMRHEAARKLLQYGIAMELEYREEEELNRAFAEIESAQVNSIEEKK